MKRKVYLWIIAVGVFIAVTGCVTQQSATHVKAFSTATAALADQAIATYDLANVSTI